MNLTEFSLKNSRLVMLLVALLTVAGIGMLPSFPSKEDAVVTIRDAVVTTYYPGMSPRRVEDLITRKVEEYIRKIPEVEDIYDVKSATGVSIIYVKVYDKFFDLDRIWNNLRNKMDDVKPELPKGTIGPIVDDEFGDVSVVLVALTAKGFSMAEMRDVARDMRDDFYTLEGIRKVELHGVQDERVFLEISNARLAQYGLTPTQLAQSLREQNIILPGGAVDTGTVELVVEPTGNFESMKDIENVVIKLPKSNQVAYLKDIAAIKRAYVDPPEKKVYYNGEPAIILAVEQMEKGVNVLDFTPLVEQRVKEWQDRLPVGYKVDIAFQQARYVKESVNGVAMNLAQTLVTVLVVVMLFLGWRTGLIVGTIVPLTMIVTLVFMRVLGLELHRITLATLIISLGLLVDNGIVMAEEIGRRMLEGEKRWDAAINAGKTLALPLLTSSLTTILAFVPLAMAPNVTGEYLSSMATVITITLLTSWALAIMVTPLNCFWFLKPKVLTEEEVQAQYQKPMIRMYKKLLDFCLGNRIVVLAIVAGLMVGAVFLQGLVRVQFMPDSERDQYMIYLDLPAGYGSNAMDHTAVRFLQWLNDKKTNPEVANSIAYVGYGGPRFFQTFGPRAPAPNISFILVTTKDYDSIYPSMDRARDYLAANFPEAYARIKKFWLGANETGLVEVRISGPGHDKIYELSQQVEEALRKIPGTVGIYNDWENRVSKILVDIDQARARRAGVTSEEIANSLNTFFSGGIITDYREEDKVIPVMFRAIGAERKTLDRLRTVEVYSSTKNISVPLTQVADLRAETMYNQIYRRNLLPTVTVEAKHRWLQAAELEEALQPALDKIMKDLPTGYFWEWGGESENSAKAQNALRIFIPHALGAMILLMVWQFNSYAKPAIIFITIPLVLIGAAPGMLLTGAFFGFMAILGFLSLAGIIINNAIVLLDSIQNEIDAGVEPYNAVQKACLTRFKPVLMTTLTTILGLVSLMIPPDAMFFAMAVVISFGLGAGTLLTLVVVPVLYAMFFRVKKTKAVAG
ncbi:MAG: efflux RND transporter permease subunit [Deltaproteobacteria bacterium]|nr:efflux RND transporter permease subunit [Deltaproteobacteria bacterium]MBW2071861.1 efflux RND transporter permease subunit [Deltaproteobacteria bacterium]